MDVNEFIDRFNELPDDYKWMLMAEVFGMMKALNKTELLVRTLEEYEQKNSTY